MLGAAGDERYTRLHRTSGTSGRPLFWLDTPESCQWWLGCWQEIYRAAGVTAADRVFVPFSFGPFIGFWTTFEAAQQLGAWGWACGVEGRVHVHEPEFVAEVVPVVAVALAEESHRRLALRPRVEVVPPGSLPRYELKARRFKPG